MSNKQKRKPNLKLEKLYKEQGSCCYYCKGKFDWELITRDHIVPKKNGGKLRGNSVFACGSCNKTKGSKSLEEFKLDILGRLVRILKSIVDNDFIATQSMVDKFKRQYKILTSVSGLINNNNTPIFGDLK